MDGWMDRWMGGWRASRWKGGWLDALWINGWMDDEWIYDEWIIIHSGKTQTNSENASLIAMHGEYTYDNRVTEMVLEPNCTLSGISMSPRGKGLGRWSCFSSAASDQGVGTGWVSGSDGPK